MAIKPTTAKRKTLSKKVRDLAARKDPKGGAQKKESPAAFPTKGRGTHGHGKRQLL
jgi:hypothetical protein